MDGAGRLALWFAMGFVVVLSGAQTALAREVAAALRRQNIDVCVPLQEEIGALRASACRSLALEASAIIAVWSQQGLEDPLFCEVLLSAAASGKLIAASTDGSRPRHASFPSLTPCATEALVVAARQLVAPVRSAIAAREYGDLRRACESGAAAPWRRFLRLHPDGIFHALARAELEFVGAPAYQPRRVQFDDASMPWRMRGRLPKWKAAALAGLLAVGALAFVAIQAPPDRNADLPTVQAPFVAPAPQTRLASLGEASQIEPAQGAFARTQENLVGADPTAREVLPTPPQANNNTTPARALAPVRPQLRQDVGPGAPVERLVSLGATSNPGQAAFDSGRLELDLQAVVEQARRRQTYAQSRAARPGSAHILVNAAGGGSYRGDWASGGPNGLGAASWDDGARYEGSWRGAKPNGLGVLNLASGVRYEGEFHDGVPTGRGVFWTGDGRRITGEAIFRALVNARSVGFSPLPETEIVRQGAEN